MSGVMQAMMATAAVTSPSGPVLYYDPSNSSSYPGTGITVNSLVTPNISGGLTNVTYTSPYFSFNGTTSQVTVPDNTGLEPGSGNWTIELWFNAASTAGSTVLLGKFNNGGGSNDVSYSIRTSTSSVFAQLGNGAGSYINSTGFTFTTSTWYQVVYVWSTSPSKTLVTYINGSSIGSVNHSMSSLLNTTTAMYLGSYNGGEYSQWYNGKIGIVRLYNRALTSSQVLENYNNDKGKYGL